MNIPVLTGLNVLDRIKPIAGGVYMSAVEIGIPCIIANGTINDINGIPYLNEDFQAEYSKYAERLKACQCVVFARIVNEDEKDINDNAYEFGLLDRITRRSMYSGNKPVKCRIVVEDACSMVSLSMQLEYRMQMLHGIVKGFKAEFPDVRLEIQPNVRLDEFDKNKVIDFVLSNAQKQQQTLIYLRDAQYVEGANSVLTCNAFYLDANDLFRLKIKKIETLKKNDYITKEVYEIITSLEVEFNDSKVLIPYKNKKLSSNRLLLNLIRDKKVTEIEFRGVQIDGTIKHCTIL